MGPWGDDHETGRRRVQETPAGERRGEAGANRAFATLSSGETTCGCRRSAATCRRTNLGQTTRVSSRLPETYSRHATMARRSSAAPDASSSRVPLSPEHAELPVRALPDCSSTTGRHLRCHNNPLGCRCSRCINMLMFKPYTSASRGGKSWLP